MSRKKLIPFEWLPASWGLKGKSKDIAAAEYYLSGYELDAELARINFGDNSKEFTKKIIELDLQYSRIDSYTHDIKIAEIENDTAGAQLELAKLDVDLKHSKISPQEHERKRADLLNEPYMAMPKISWDPSNPSKTFFELDYNQAFVEFLRGNGYEGADEDCINRWLNDVCNSVLNEMAPSDPEFVSSIRRVRRDDGLTEHS
jgi:hypothetical protein